MVEMLSSCKSDNSQSMRTQKIENLYWGVRRVENIAAFSLNMTTQHSHGQYNKLKLAMFMTDEADSRLKE